MWYGFYMDNNTEYINRLNPHTAEEFVVELSDTLAWLASLPCVFADVNTTCSLDVDDTLCNPCLARHLAPHDPHYS